MTDHALPAKILIVDDHPLVREGLSLRVSLQPFLTVCGEAASEEEALTLVKNTKPDLAIVDISLQSGNGLDLVTRIKSKYPQVKMLVISGFDESLYAERSLRAGALGYLNKQDSNEKVLEAIRTVLRGQRFVSPALSDRLLNQALQVSEDGKTPVDTLSNRELEIFRLIGAGLTSSVIAKRLRLSIHTIDTHRENIKRKLAISNAAELSRAAVQWVMENG